MSERLFLEKAVDILDPHVDELPKLVQVLDPLIGSEPDLDRLATIATALGSPGILPRLLKGVLADSGTLSNVDRNSYQFRGEDEYGAPKAEWVHLGLAQAPGGDVFTARWLVDMHIWPPEFKNELHDTIHNHAREMGSFCITGTFRDKRYRLVQESDRLDDDLKMDVFRGYEMTKPVGEALLRPTPGREIPAGRAHVISPELIHEVVHVPDDGIVATIVVRAERLPGTRVAHYREADVPASMLAMTPVETDEYLKRVLTILPNNEFMK